MKLKILGLAFLFFQVTNAQDITLQKKPIHFSVVHYISNHSSESSNNSYLFSFNLLTGKIGSINGFEISGLYNQNTQNMSGLQISGLLNNTKNKVRGVQIAGLSNFSGETLGIQYAGISNISNNFNGIQTSGIVNIAKDLKGIQISGIYNQVKKLNGLQISLVNVVDSIQNGGTIGLINIVKKGGYREWEISMSDFQNIGLSYKTGGKHIYSILNAGYNFSSDPLMVYGLGIGSILDINPKWKFRPELIWLTYFDDSFKSNPSTNSAHLKFGLMRKLNDKMAITFMPSVFMSYKEKNEASYGYETTKLKSFSSKSNTESLREIGFGLGIGLSFLK